MVVRVGPRSEGTGLTAVSLACLNKYEKPADGLLAYKVFLDRKARETLMQDFYLLAVQVWRAEAPFAFLLPLADLTISVATRKLPGVSHNVGGHLQLPYSCRSEDVPCCFLTPELGARTLAES